jgi:hypothetical protein
MPNLTYGEMRVLWLGVIALVCALGAAVSGEGVFVVPILFGVAGTIFFVAWQRLKR